MGISLKISSFIPSKLLNNTLASCSVRHFNFLLLDTENLDKSIILPFLVLATFVFLLSVFFYTSSNKIALFYIWFKFLFVIEIFHFFSHITKYFQHIIY